MENQVIISISREYGSGGHEIAEKIANDLGIKFYDKGMLDEIASHMDIKVEVLEEFDEKPRNRIFTRRVGKHTNSMEEILAEIQFDFIKSKAEKGESFIIVGRCSETVLEDYDNLISIFISGDKKCRIKRIMNMFQLSEADAKAKIAKKDLLRKKYHNRHSDYKWGDSRHYDICINSSPLDVDGTVRVLENYIRERIEQMKRAEE